MHIRLATTKDLPRMRALYAPHITDETTSFEYTVPTTEAFLQRFLNITRQFPWLVAEEDGVVLGYAYASPAFERAAYGWDADLSIYVAPESQGKGVGKRLALAVESILKRQGYCLIYSIIAEENTGSIAFHRALGYQEVAFFPKCGFKLGAWRNVVWYCKRIAGEEPPRPVLPFPQLEVEYDLL